MKKLLVQVITNWKDPYNRKRHTEIPSMNPDDLEKAMKYCELNKITGVLYDTNVIMGNEWYYINGILTSRERYEEIMYEH